jgi:hypothetical protein
VLGWKAFSYVKEVVTRVEMNYVKGNFGTVYWCYAWKFVFACVDCDLLWSLS